MAAQQDGHVMAVDVLPVGFDAVTDEANGRPTKHRSVRIEDDLWKPLEVAAAANGHDRSSLIRQFVRWYLAVPGARLPQRPDQQED
jgi:hypothetical protein